MNAAARMKKSRALAAIGYVYVCGFVRAEDAAQIKAMIDAAKPDVALAMGEVRK